MKKLSSWIYSVKKKEDIIKIRFLMGLFSIKKGYKNIKYYFCGIQIFRKKRKSDFNDDKIHISIFIDGGLGDLVYALRYIKGMSEYFNNEVVLDVLAEEKFILHVQSLLYQQNFVHNLYSKDNVTTKYDLAIRLVRFPQVVYVYEYRLNEKVKQYYELIKNFNEKNVQVIQNDFLGREYSKLHHRHRADEGDIDDILNLKNVNLKINTQDFDNTQLNQINFKKVILIQSGAGQCFGFASDVRQWPIECYESLISLIKEKYVDYKIIQIGAIHHQKVSNVDVDLRGKTSFSELLSILKNAHFYISQEGGMSILRHFLDKRKSCVLFGATDVDFFSFPENINLTARRCPCPCEWLIPTWWQKCEKTGNQAECMLNLTSEYVFEKIKDILGNK